MSKAQPQLVFVDPKAIRLNPRNPREHRGSEFLALKESIRIHGIVQLPSLRTIGPGLYECIDGEGRILGAQEEGLSGIPAITYGVIDDATADTMAQAANMLRSFSLLAECRGLANLHRQGKSTHSLANEFGGDRRGIGRKVGIGYFPAKLHQKIEEDIARSEEQAGVWGLSMLRELLPLRQVIPGKNPGQDPLDEVYDYGEVQKAINLVIAGEISHVVQMVAYVERRRRELLEERLDQEVQRRLERELESSRKLLTAGHEQDLQGVREELAVEYKEQLTRLQVRVDELEGKRQQLLVEVARRPEIAEEFEEELRQKIEELETERTRLQKVQAEAKAVVETFQEELKKAVEETATQHRAELEEEFQEARKHLEAYYKERDEMRQLKAEKSVRQAVAHCKELMAEVEQSLALIASEGFIKGLAWLEEWEMQSLLAQMKVLRETLYQAEESILRGETVTVVDVE